MSSKSSQKQLIASDALEGGHDASEPGTGRPQLTQRSPCMAWLVRDAWWIVEAINR
jgi:hypothetical protein